MALVDKIRGLLGNPFVQGVGGAVAFGANPLFGLLAGAGIESARDRRQAENEARRNELSRRKREEATLAEIRGILADQTTVQSPDRTVGLLDVEGGDPTLFNLPGRRQSVPTVETQVGRQQLQGLLGGFDPVGTAKGLLAQQPQRDVAALIDSLTTAPDSITGGGRFQSNIRLNRNQKKFLETLAQVNPEAALQALGSMLGAPGTTQAQGFETPTGKLFNDLTLAEQRGNFEAVAAIRSAIQQKIGPAVNFDDVRSSRNDVIKNSQGFLSAQAGFQRVETGFSAATPAGDLAGIFGFMKVLDPRSTVREGEFANVANSGSVPTRIRNFYNRIRTGERLTPSQRADFRSQARAQFEKSIQLQNRLLDEARGFAGRNKLTVADVVPEFLVPAELPEPVEFTKDSDPFSLTPAERAELQQLRQELGL